MEKLKNDESNAMDGGVTLGPEQLIAIRESFDEACLRLRESGHDVGASAASQLAAIMVTLGAKGLTGTHLIQRAVEAFEFRKLGLFAADRLPVR